MRKRDIKKLLGSDLAQNDKNFLSYAIERKEILDELADPDNYLVILNAPRGSGKSGLILSTESFLQEYSKRNVIIKKYYEEVKFIRDVESIHEHVNFWKNSIFGWIVSNIGTEKNIAWTDDEMASVEYAESEGEKELSFIGSILKRLKFKSLPIEKVDFDPLLTEATLSRIVKKARRNYWLLLDEMDDLYSNSPDRNKSLVGLFQAANYISSRFDNVKIRITIRPHIYSYLKTNFDSIQKLRESVVKIGWTEDQLRTILARRVEYYESGFVDSENEQLELSIEHEPLPNESKFKSIKERKVAYESNLIGRYFDDFDMKFVKGSGSNYRAFHTVSMERPRWMIEYCKIALEQRPEGRRATTDCFKLAFAEYGRNRVDFVAGEFKEMYPELSAVINSIASARTVKIGSYKSLRNLIKSRVFSNNIIPTPKDATHDEINELALIVAKSLFVTEFIRAKQSLGGVGRDHRFYSYTLRPNLLDGWNKEKNISWEIHPTFARALNIIDSGVYDKGGQTRSFKKDNNR